VIALVKKGHGPEGTFGWVAPFGQWPKAQS
jgi:hypothetical protein